MRLSIPLVVYALGWFGTALSRPIYTDDDFQVSRGLQAEGSQLRELEADNYSSRELLNIIPELDERDILQELESRARPKISKAAQTARKQTKATQANKNGKAMGPISPAQMAKKAAGKAKQNTKNANRKTAKNNRNQAMGYTQAAAQQRTNKANAGTNAWPARNAAITNGRNTVSGKDVRKAVFESNKHTAAGTNVIANPGGRNPSPHPHNFSNFPNRQRTGRNPHMDYGGAPGRGGRPVDMTGRGKEFAVTSPNVFTGGNPGAMRVITQNGNYKGVVSHDPTRPRGHPNGGDLFKVIRREEDAEDLSA